MLSFPARLDEGFPLPLLDRIQLSNILVRFYQVSEGEHLALAGAHPATPKPLHTSTASKSSSRRVLSAEIPMARQQTRAHVPVRSLFRDVVGAGQCSCQGRWQPSALSLSPRISCCSEQMFTSSPGDEDKAMRALQHCKCSIHHFALPCPPARAKDHRCCRCPTLLPWPGPSILLLGPHLVLPRAGGALP